MRASGSGGRGRCSCRWFMHLATRTWFYDGNFQELLKEDMQIVLAGSGYDCRAYRF